MRALLIAVAVALAVLPAGVSSASAAPPSPVSIQVHPTQFCCPQIGTWGASGAIADSGSYVRTEAATSPPDRPPFTLGPFRETFVLSGALGMLTVRDQSQVTATGVTGVWEIASGTGAYDGASGHGTLSFDGPTLTLLLEGVISKVG
jgi:hypothetical protein